MWAPERPAEAEDHRQQPIEIQRLGEPGGPADVARLLLHASVRADDDDRNLRDLPPPELLLAELPAVHHRHRHVEEDEARIRLLLETLERRAAVLRLQDVEARLLEVLGEALPEERVVLDNEDRAHESAFEVC